MINKIEIINRELQAEQLNFGELNKKISTTKNVTACIKDKFFEIWEAVNAETTLFELNEPILPRIQKAPKTSPVLCHTLLRLKSIIEKNITRLLTPFQSL